VKGLYGGAPKDWQQASAQEMAQLLPEDHITCLAEDPATGMILFGTRLKGIGVFDPLQEQYVGDLNSYWKTNDRFIRAIVPLSDRRVSFGCYLGGFTTIDPKKQLTSLAKKSGLVKSNRQTSNRQINTVATKNFPPLPSVIKPLSIEEIKAMQAKLESLNEPLPTPYAGYLGEDWKTQGDWLGRTTKNWAIMCAAVSPLDRHVLMCGDYYRVESFIGPNATPDDTIRRWCHWIKTNNPSSLWDPLNGYRRQAEWDDHGEAYPLSKDGPDMWYLLEIRNKGMFRIGMYFFNKDGHAGMNRLRDYLIEVYPSPRQWTVKDFYEDWKNHSLEAEKIAWSQPPLTRTRMRDFWGGVYKQVLVAGPGNYYVKIDRNYSFNTILSAVIVERLQGEPTHEESIGIPFVSPYLPKENPYRRPPTPPKSYETEEGWRIGRFWKTLDEIYCYKGGLDTQRKNRIMAYQWAMFHSDNNMEITQASKAFQWQLNQWDERQRKEWREAMETAFKTHYDENESLRKSIESQKHGPPQFFLDRHKWQR
jgi:hypothetical protein